MLSDAESSKTSASPTTGSSGVASTIPSSPPAKSSENVSVVVQKTRVTYADSNITNPAGALPTESPSTKLTETSKLSSEPSERFSTVSNGTQSDDSTNKEGKTKKKEGKKKNY